jgi:hypothetical protein
MTMNTAQQVLQLAPRRKYGFVWRLIATAMPSLWLLACASPYADCPLPETFDVSLFDEVQTPSGNYYPSNLNTRTHRVYKPSAAPRPELVVHLPGHGNEPENQTKLVQTAAFAGFRAIGLVWSNETLAADDCTSDPNFNDCLETTRTERGFGAGVGSVQRELTDLLTALDTDYPADGWGDFLDSGVPDWDKIILAGYSEGANQGAFMAKQVEFKSVVLISGGGNFGVPPPNSMTDPLADWLIQPGATPGYDHIALYHEGEPFAAAYPVAYDAIGLGTLSFARVPEDQTTGWPDFLFASRLEAHFLTSPVNPTDYPQCEPHGSTVPDTCLDYGLGQATYDLLKAHTYLFCFAGSRR